MLASLHDDNDDSWKDYPTAGNLEWLLHLKLYGAIEQPNDSLTFLVLDAYPPEIIHSKILARLSDERKPQSLEHPEAQKLLKKSVDLEKKAMSKLKNTLGLTFDQYLSEKRFWLHNSSRNILMSGLYNVLLINFRERYGAILQQYFTHLTPPHAAKSKELEALAIIAYKTLGLKKIFVASLWVPKNDLTLAVYTADRLHSLHHQLQIDLKPFESPP